MDPSCDLLRNRTLIARRKVSQRAGTKIARGRADIGWERERDAISPRRCKTMTRARQMLGLSGDIN